MPGQIVKIELLGLSFTIQTDESIDYMESLIMRLRERFESLKATIRVSDPLKISLLTNITLLDELLRARSQQPGASNPEEQRAQEEEISRLTARLIDVIDQSLDPSAGA
ncbi:MAG TPA: cell division protein ZapA [Rectinemataceae bacterium]|nr:cell division protein ZapA [Rectinemataceae bacterium]